RHDLDVGLLMWDMRRSIKPQAFPQGRVSVQFDFSDLPASKRTWWLVNNGGEVDLCPNDPGFEVGLYVVSDLRTMTRVFMGDLALKAAVGSGQIELDGSRALRQQFEHWLGLSGFAEIEDARCSAAPGRQRDRADRRRAAHHQSARGGPAVFTAAIHILYRIAACRAGAPARPKNCIENRII